MAQKIKSTSTHKMNLRKAKSAADQEQVKRMEIPVFRADPEVGLSQEAVRLRLEHGYDNRTVNGPSKTVKQIVMSNVFTFFNLIFFLLALFVISSGSFRDLMFLPIVIANTAIGIVQELRAKQTLDKLSLLSAPHATVIRDGTEQTVSSEELVRDDVVIFSSGNQIGADATVLSGEIQVNESLITGESNSIIKKEGDSLLSGSFVVSGKCRARLDQVGADSYVSKLTVEAKKNGKRRKSEMMNSLNKLIIVIGIIVIPFGIILFSQQMFTLGLSYQRSVVATAAALIGMIPEGLYLLTSVALAVSVVRLASHKTLVQELNCIETLARVDVLCVDKTGTITENAMRVDEIVPLTPDICGEEDISGILNAFYRVMDADNNTAQAMKERFSEPSSWKAEKTIPFSSATKWSAASFGDEGSFIVGAPEFILQEQYAPYRETVEGYSAQGSRVLLLAQYDGILDESLSQGGPFTAPLYPLALITISNRIRESAPETFHFFEEQGVAIKVISGDNPLTVSEVARKAGVAGAEHYVDAATLTTAEQIEQAVNDYTVFGRVTPDQKRKFVKALKKAGHTVAMTGDGVNDVLALKDADCSVAMASGSDAACHVSQLVLLNSDFASMPQVVMEGRRVINNIERATSLFLVKNIFSFLLALITIFVTLPYPVTPMQLSMVSLVTIGIPSFFLALEPNSSLVHGHFLRNVIRRALPGALTDLFVVLGVLMFHQAFDLTTDELSTISAIMLAIVGLMVLYQVSKPLNKPRMAVLAAMILLFGFCVFVMGDFFMLSKLSWGATLVLAVFIMLAYPVMHLILKVFEKVSEILLTITENHGKKQRRPRKRHRRKHLD